MFCGKYIIGAWEAEEDNSICKAFSDAWAEGKDRKFQAHAKKIND